MLNCKVGEGQDAVKIYDKGLQMEHMLSLLEGLGSSPTTHLHDRGM